MRRRMPPRPQRRAQRTWLDVVASHWCEVWRAVKQYGFYITIVLAIVFAIGWCIVTPAVGPEILEKRPEPTVGPQPKPTVGKFPAAKFLKEAADKRVPTEVGPEILGNRREPTAWENSRDSHNEKEAASWILSARPFATNRSCNAVLPTDRGALQFPRFGNRTLSAAQQRRFRMLYRFHGVVKGDAGGDRAVDYYLEGMQELGLFTDPQRQEGLFILTKEVMAKVREKVVQNQSVQYRQTNAGVRHGPGQEDVIPCPAPSIVPILMRKWFRYANDRVARINASDPRDVVWAACEIHTSLVHIHPYADGNGRTARAVAGMLLHHYGLPPALLRQAERNEYGKAVSDALVRGNYTAVCSMHETAVVRAIEQLRALMAEVS
jgi:hypothetical protein